MISIQQSSKSTNKVQFIFSDAIKIKNIIDSNPLITNEKNDLKIQRSFYRSLTVYRPDKEKTISNFKSTFNFNSSKIKIDENNRRAVSPLPSFPFLLNKNKRIQNHNINLYQIDSNAPEKNRMNEELIFKLCDKFFTVVEKRKVGSELILNDMENQNIISKKYLKLWTNIKKKTENLKTRNLIHDFENRVGFLKRKTIECKIEVEKALSSKENKKLERPTVKNIKETNMDKNIERKQTGKEISIENIKQTKIDI